MLGWSARLNGKTLTTIKENVDQPDYTTDVVLQFHYSLDNLFGSTRVINETDPWGGIGTNVVDASTDVMQFMTNVTNSTAKIAQGLTNYIQRYGDVQVSGQAYTTTTVVEVHWAWLSLPLAVAVLCVLALVITIFQTRAKRIPIWTTSPYPMILDYDHRNASETSSLNTSRNDGSNDTRSGGGSDQERATPAAAATTALDHDQIAEETFLRLIKRNGQWTFERTL